VSVQSVNFDPDSLDIEPVTNIDRLLIVRLSAMGDVIHTLPAVHALREAYPQAHIGWLIEERWAELLRAPGAPRRGGRSSLRPPSLRPLVDEVHIVNLKAWGKSPLSISTLQRVATVWNDVRDVHYDAAVDLQGAIRSAVLARLSGASVVYGAAEPRESPASLWYTRKVVARGRHVIEQNLSVVEGLIGHEMKWAAEDVASDFPCDLPRDPRAEARIEQRLAEDGVRDFAILNPGAGWGAKRWPAERYGEVAGRLAGLGICPLVNYGPGEEDLFRAVLATSGGQAKPTKGTITELIALTRRARVFIGGDTGPLHLAAALRVPVVAIFGPTDPARNGPYGTRSIVLRSTESVTTHARRAAPEAGLLTIGSNAVVAAARDLIGV
jgi:heptosyltransferase-1